MHRGPATSKKKGARASSSRTAENVQLIPQEDVAVGGDYIATATHMDRGAFIFKEPGDKEAGSRT